MKSKIFKKVLSIMLVLAMVFTLPGGSTFVYAAEADTVVPETEEAAVAYEFGSGKTLLTPGKYDLPVSLNKAGAENQPSMAAACVKRGVVSVAEDGNATVTLEMGAVSVGAISGWGSDWKIYPEAATYKDVTETSRLEACEFTTNEQGEADTITFAVPDNSWDGVYTKMHIEVMGLDQDAYFKLDYANATPYAEPVPVTFAAGENGTLEASVDGQLINSGDMVKSGKTVTFTANPNQGFVVDAWTGIEATGKTASVVVEQALDVTVSFAEKVYANYVVTFTAGENGTLEAFVDGNAIESGAEIREGSTVTFKAVPNKGYKVIDWTGVNSNGNEASAYVNGNLNVTVKFGLELNRAELDKAIEEGDALVNNANDYLDDRNWSNFVFELGEAKISGLYLTQAQIDKEVRVLRRCMNFAAKADKEALKAQIDRANNDNYTAYPVSVSGPVRKVYEKSMPYFDWNHKRAKSQAELDNLAGELSKALDVLEEYAKTAENTVELIHEDGTVTAYKTFVEAYKAYADTDKAIKLTQDVDMNSDIDRRGDMDSNSSVNVDLNGFTLNNNGKTICLNTLTGDKGGVLNSNVKFFSDITLGANITVNGFVHSAGKITIDGATITSKDDSAIAGDPYFELKEIVINSGTITSENGYAVEGYVTSDWGSYTYSPITINDGTFVGKTFAISGSGVNTINGGKFKASNGALMGAAPVVPEEMKLSTVADKEGYFKLVPADTVEKGEVIASVAGKEYTSINEAFANVKAGETVKLLKDITVYSVINVNVNCTLDVNGHVFNVAAYNQSQDFEQQGGEAGGWSAVVVNKDAKLDIVDNSAEKAGKITVVNGEEDHCAGFVSYGELTTTDVIVENLTPDYDENGKFESSLMMPYKGGKVILDNVRLSEQNKGAITATGNEYGEVTVKNTTATFDDRWDTLLCGKDAGAGRFIVENCNFTDNSVAKDNKSTRSASLNFTMKDSTWTFTNDGGILIQGFEKNNHPVIENSTITTNGNKAVEVEGVDDIKFINNTIKAPNGYAIVTRDNIMRDYRIVSGTYEGKDYAIKSAPMIFITDGKFKGNKGAVDGIPSLPDGKCLKEGSDGYYSIADGETELFQPAEGKELAIYASNGELVGGVNMSDNSNVPFAVVPNNAKIVMQKDIVVTDNTYFNKLNGGNLTFDLNGHTLDLNEYVQLVLGNGVKATIIDSQDKGVVNSAYSKVFTQFSDTALTIKGGTWNVESITASHNYPANFEGGHFNLRTAGNKIIYYNEYMAPYCQYAVITGGDYNFDVTQQYIQTFVLPGRPPRYTVSGESQLKKDTHAAYEKDGRWYVVAKEDLPAPETPVITPESKNFEKGEKVEVSISEVKDSKVYYSTDGSIPTSERGTLYEKPFTVDKTTTVKAIAISDKTGKLSTVAEATYTMLTPEVKKGTAPVSFGSTKAYDVTAEVTILGDKISKVVLTHNAKESGHASSAAYADNAKAMADKFNNLAATDKKAIDGLDAVSGATVTSDAYKTAVLEALGLNKPADLTFGTANTELKPGIYNVPISLRHAGKHQNPSAAVDAFPAMGKLTVAEDGTATLETTLNAVNKAGLLDMAYDIKVYQEDNYTSETKPVEILETVTNPEGIFRPDASKDKTVPSKISFQIPNNDWDGVYMSLYVDAMSSAPDAWLQIDYTKAAVPGTAKHYKGEAKVNQFGKYTIFTDVTVVDGLITDVAVTADKFISETHRPTNEMKIAQVTKALKANWNGMAPTQENAEAIFKKIMKEDKPEEVLDAVSGATYSARAVRDAVMNAFKLEYQEEIINVPENVKPGIYEVEIGYYSDVVWHSLVENMKTKATLTVNKDKSMNLEFDTLSGTDKEPLYILGFNGVYPNNDRAQKLTLDGCKFEMGLSSNDYEDEFFAKGTKVVNHVKFPLLGGLNKVYNTNCYLYVPAMKKLNGELSGVNFKDGHFNVDIFAKIYWDGMKKIGDVPEKPEGNKWVNEGNNWSYIKEDGTAAKAEFLKIGVNTFYFDKNGVMATGWKEVDGKWYCFAASGRMLTGWQKLGSNWFYFEADGSMVTGWKAIGTQWFYFYTSGRMLTGWQQIDGHWFYLGTNGAMTKGWAKLGGSWFYFNGSGYMATGWQAVGTKWYCFAASGRMLTGWQQIDGHWYYLKSSGEMTKGWAKLGRNWFYFNGSGHMVTGTQKINGKTYRFSNSGALL